MIGAVLSFFFLFAGKTLKQQRASGAVPRLDGSNAGVGKRYSSRMLLKDTREELGRADGKAATLMSASGVVVSVLLAGAIAGKWNPTALGYWQWLWWPGAAAGIAGIVTFAAAVWPLVRHKEPKDALTYFGHAAQYETVQNLEAALHEKVSSSKDRTTDQLLTVSKIVRRKYRLVRWGMSFIGIALVACASAIVLATLL